MGHITEYFTCWETCLRDLHKAIFGSMTINHVTSMPFNCEYTNPSPITYEKMIAILKEMLKIAEFKGKGDNMEGKGYRRNNEEKFYDTDDLDSQTKQKELAAQLSLCPADTNSQVTKNNLLLASETPPIFSEVENLKITEAFTATTSLNLQVYSEEPIQVYPTVPYTHYNLPPGTAISLAEDNTSIFTSDLPSTADSDALDEISVALPVNVTTNFPTPAVPCN